jgi:hypothetical protein
MPNIELLVKLMDDLVANGTIEQESLIESFKLKFEELVDEEADFAYTKRALCMLFRNYARNCVFQIS